MNREETKLYITARDY